MKLIQIIRSGRCVFLIFLLGASGCTSIHNHYPIVNHPKLSLADLAVQTNKPSVELTFEFLSRGAFSPAVTKRWQPHVTQFLDSTQLFSKVNSKGTQSDFSMRIQMDNVIDSLAGAYAQGFFSGLTLGTVGTKTTDNYVIMARLENDTGESVKKEYRYGITSTTGLIKGSVANVKPHKNVNGAFQEVLDQFLLEWLVDLQKEHRLQPPLKPTGSGL